MQIEGQKHRRRYNATTQTAYLPGNKEGWKVCKLMKEAFGKRLLFAVYELPGQPDQLQVMWTVDYKPSTIGRYVQSMHSDKGITLTVEAWT